MARGAVTSSRQTPLAAVWFLGSELHGAYRVVRSVNGPRIMVIPAAVLLALLAITLLSF